MPKTICLDFDGVLNTYDGWKGDDVLFDPRPGAKEFIERLFDNGYEVVIHTTRPAEKILQWWRDNKFPGAEWIGPRIAHTKPPAFAYLDDRGICFTGNFNLAFEQIRDFRAFWEKQPC
jgi:hypothetical protein